MSTVGAPRALESWEKRVFWASYVGFIFEAYDLTLYALLVVPISKFFHVPVWFSFFVLTSSYVTRGLGGLVFGHIADRFGRRVTLITTVLGYSVMTALTGLSWSVGSLLLWRALSGLFIGGEFTSYAYVMESVPNGRRGTLGGFLDTAYGLGFIIASLSFTALAAGTSFSGNVWRIPFFFGILPALIALWVRIGVEESHPWLKVARSPQARPRVPLFAIFGRRYLGRTLHSWGIMAALIWSYDVLVISIPSLLSMLKFPRTEIGTMSTILTVGLIVSAALWGFLSERMGRRRALIVDGILTILSMPLIAHFWTLPARPGFLAMSVGVFVVAVLMQGAFAIMPSYLPERFPTEIRATGSTGTYNLGQIVGAWSITLLSRLFVGPVHFMEGMLLFGGVGLAVAVVLFFTGPETRDVDLANFTEHASVVPQAR